MSIEHVKEFDAKNGDTLCQDVIVKDIYQVSVPFQILEEGESPLPGWTKSTGHIIFDINVSCSSPRWYNLPSGHQRYPLKGLNLGYMYWGKNKSSE